MDRSSSIGLDPDDYRFLLSKQRAEYEKIRNQSSQHIQLVLSVVSLAASFGAVQYLMSGGIDAAEWDIPFQLANRCAPEALTFSGTSLVGLGFTNSVLGFGLIFLGLWLVGEMWYLNRRLQGLPTMRPRNEVEILIRRPAEWIQSNQSQIETAHSLYRGVSRRMTYSALLGLIGGTLLIAVYQDRAILLMVGDFILLCVGVVLLSLWGREYLAGKEDGVFRLRLGNWEISTGFAFLFLMLWVFTVRQCYQIYRLLDYLILC
jgi:hypothetical protein